VHSKGPCDGMNFIMKIGGFGFVRIDKNPKYYATHEIEKKAI
jgi:hypothetical protein